MFAFSRRPCKNHLLHSDFDLLRDASIRYIGGIFIRWFFFLSLISYFLRCGYFVYETLNKFGKCLLKQMNWLRLLNCSDGKCHLVSLKYKIQYIRIRIRIPFAQSQIINTLNAHTNTLQLTYTLLYIYLFKLRSRKHWKHVYVYVLT